jgi:sugar phosphate permease
MTGSAVVAAGCLIGTALSQSLWQYYACWALFGLCIPGLSTVGPAVAISNWFVRKRPQAVMVFTLGSAMAGLVLVPVLTQVVDRFDWRTAWVCLALLFVIAAPMAWAWVGKRPEDYGLLPDGAAEPASSAPQNEPGAVAADQWTAAGALRSRSFWLLAVAFMLTSFPAASIFIHMPSFVESKGFSDSEGALALSFYGLGTLAGRFSWAWLVTRIGVFRCLVGYGFGYGLSILLFVAPHNLPAIYATTVLLGIAIAGSQQLHVLVFPEYFGRRIVGTLLGYAGAISAVTAAAAPLLAAAAYDSTGIDHVHNLRRAVLHRRRRLRLLKAAERTTRAAEPGYS